MSPRPKSIRKIQSPPDCRCFKPDGKGDGGSVSLHVEEYEAVRLCDYMDMTHMQAAVLMGVSRPTFTRIYAQARRKLAKAIVERKAVLVEGGKAYMDDVWYKCPECGAYFNNIDPSVAEAELFCPVCGSRDFTRKEYIDIKDNIMKKIALPTAGDRIDDHFGHCEYYTVVTVSDEGKITSVEKMASPQGCGCKSDIAEKLRDSGVVLMLAGNMGVGALNKLNSCGIEVIRGCSGPVREVVDAYLEGKLTDSGLCCSHHGEDGHQCSGGNGHGSHKDSNTDWKIFN